VKANERFFGNSLMSLLRESHITNVAMTNKRGYMHSWF